MMSQNVGQKEEVGIKTGGKENERIAAMLTMSADGGNFPLPIIFEGKPTG